MGAIAHRSRRLIFMIALFCRSISLYYPDIIWAV